MKTRMFAITLCVLLYYTHTVSGVCVICPYKTPLENCTERYVPNGPESLACNSAIDVALCRKYGGGYRIACRTLTAIFSCDMTSPTLCPPLSGQSTLSPNVPEQTTPRPCTICSNNTPLDQCTDVFDGSFSSGCNGPIDANLCNRYGGGYRIYCNAPVRNCVKMSSPCPNLPQQSSPNPNSEGSCTICPNNTPLDQCTDVFDGSFSSACNGPIDANLCNRYGGGYRIYCKATERNCVKMSSPCPNLPQQSSPNPNSEGSCAVCPYKTPVDQCTDHYEPNGPVSSTCTNPLDMDLCRKYGGGYRISCTTPGGSISCAKKSSSCQDLQTHEHPNSAGQYQSMYWYILLSVVAAMFKYH